MYIIITNSDFLTSNKILYINTLVRLCNKIKYIVKQFTYVVINQYLFSISHLLTKKN